MDDGETTVAARVRPGKSISVFVETGVEVVRTRRGRERRRRVGHRVPATGGDIVRVPARTVRSMPDVLELCGDVPAASATGIVRSEPRGGSSAADYPPDVSKMTVREVERAVAGVDDTSVLAEMLDVERGLKDRSTALRAIKRRMEAVSA